MKQLRPYQIKAIEAVENALAKGITKQLLVMATGCHAKGTKILMYSGRVKNVEDVQVGDQLMGDDNTPRTVLSLARGNEKMAKIIPIKGEPFEVNINHILSLKRTNVGVKSPHKENYYPKILNITVKDYLLLPKTWKHLYKLYKTEILNFPKTLFQELNKIEVDPYFIGLWIGDGTVGSTNITKDEPELDEYFSTFSYKGTISKKNDNKEKCSHHSFTTTIGQPNPLRNFLKTLFINEEKRIPFNYLTSSISQRFSLLAGLLDSDGYLNDDKCSYEIATKYNGLCEDILFLCRSLGLRATANKKIGKIKSRNFEAIYNRINISGYTDFIPCKIKRKIANPRKQIKNCLVTGFKVELLENDNYYGFELDGNHLYCMGDFTVTHNTGKTFTSIKCIENKGTVLWITHTEELIDQSAKAFIADKCPEFSNQINQWIDNNNGLPNAIEHAQLIGQMANQEVKWLSNNIGVIKADKFMPDAPIVFASAQTLWRRLDKLDPKLFDVVVCDESHLFGAPTYVKSINHFTPKLLLGLTATPFRADGMMLGDIFDEIIFQYNIADAIKEKNLCQIDAIRVKTTLNLDGIRTTAGELNQKDLKETVDIPERNKLIVQKWKEYALNRPTIVFCVDVEHAKNVCQTFKDEGISVDVVVGDETVTTDRKGTINDFKEGKLTVLTNCMILTAGFDHPEVSCIINACPTKSQTKFLQSIGRGTRLKKGQFKDLIILDIVDSTTRHRLVNTYTLEKDKPLEERVFMTEEKRNALIEKRDEANKRKFESKTKKDERIQLIPLPKVKQSNSIRMQEAATEKQLAWIARLGYDIVNTHYTKLMCNQIIDNLSATVKQIAFLKWRGYDVSNGCTIAEAKAAFKQLEAKENRIKQKEVKKEIFKNLPIKGL